MSLLAVEDLTKEFGGLRALDGLSVSVDRGDLVGVMGPNGAGKTTLFNCVSGIVRPDGGAITFDGTDVTGNSPEALARAGMIRTFQLTRELRTMTVRDNVGPFVDLALAALHRVGAQQCWEGAFAGLVGRRQPDVIADGHGS